MTGSKSPSLGADLDFIPHVVPQLRIMVENYRSRLPEDQYRQLIGSIKNDFTHFYQLLSKYPAGAQRAIATHNLINKEIAAASGFEATCYKGCGSCCHLEVEITKDEGALLAMVVRNGHEIDFGRLQLQAARERRSPDWAPMIKPENRCVFLDESNSCSIYDFRPSICRKHLVTSPPAHCITDGATSVADPKRFPVAVLIPYAEIILSAALSQPDNERSTLSKNLLAALGQDESAQSGMPDDLPCLESRVQASNPGH